MKRQSLPKLKTRVPKKTRIATKFRGCSRNARLMRSFQQHIAEQYILAAARFWNEEFLKWFLYGSEHVAASEELNGLIDEITNNASTLVQEFKILRNELP